MAKQQKPKKSTTRRLNKPKYKKLRSYMLPLVSLFLLLLLFCMTLYAREQSRLASELKEFESVLQKQGVEVPGRSCAILSAENAQDILGQPVKRSSTNYSQPIVYNGERIRWYLDNCRYEAQSTTDRYVELFITTYNDAEIAQQEFERKPPLVSDVEILDAELFDADKLVHDAGVHYVLRGKQIVEVAASNGNPAESQEFSYNILSELIGFIEQ